MSELAAGARLTLLGLHSPRVNFSAKPVFAREIDLIPGWFYAPYGYAVQACLKSFFSPAATTR